MHRSALFARRVERTAYASACAPRAPPRRAPLLEVVVVVVVVVRLVLLRRVGGLALWCGGGRGIVVLGAVGELLGEFLAQLRVLAVPWGGGR